MRRKFIYNNNYFKQARVLLRRNKTETEKFVWMLLRRKPGGIKWYRQYSVGKFILDFYCPSKKLAVEIDGSGHEKLVISNYDKERTEYLKLHGIAVKRFKNFEIEQLGEKFVELLLV
jgi:very-short-patch-repair endonuclease